MSNALLHRQAELPRTIPLFRHVPKRAAFSWAGWQPEEVRSAADLPPYLILGALDPSSFKLSPSGWSARWKGLDKETHFEVTYQADTQRWEVQQRWCGLDGGFSAYPARLPLNQLIPQTLYMQFPSNWDSEAKTQLESTYQLAVVEAPKTAYSLCGIPDGALRSIVFPVAIHNLRPILEWLLDLVDTANLPYPIFVEAKMGFQAINHIEGKAPEWTAQGALSFRQSVLETGLFPLSFPVREVASDGSAAWTVRREIYFLFIGLPFAGLTDFLKRMHSVNGPLRRTQDPDLRVELRPFVIPTALDAMADHLEFWDKARTTRSYLNFKPEEDENAQRKSEAIPAGEPNLEETLTKIEALSSEAVLQVKKLFEQAKTGGG